MGGSASSPPYFLFYVNPSAALVPLKRGQLHNHSQLQLVKVSRDVARRVPTVVIVVQFGDFLQKAVESPI